MEMHANTCRLDSVAVAGIGVSGGEVLLLINLGRLFSINSAVSQAVAIAL
jgi:hypothetical protein